MKTDAVIDHVTGWLTDYCEKSNLHGYTVGVSGGVDSAVTSTLCARTGLPVRALILPIHQDPDQVALAQAHVDWLTDRFANVTAVRIDLTPVFDAFVRTVPDMAADGLTQANTRSRLRMVALYAQAGCHGLLVAGTGNKVEDFGVGFFTKYGDGGVDVAPLADLVKSEVYQVARRLEIRPEILDAPPTDGLWADNRTDEAQIGATYAELEWAMDFDCAPAGASSLSPRQQEVLAIYRRLNRAARHKIDPIPVCRIPPELRE
ncbi:MAG: NAD(+) synthase [Desulfosudaceae bacterium]